jgi:hypothetical protein
MRSQGFIRPELEVNLDVVTKAEDVIPAYYARRAKTRDIPPVGVIQDKL